MVKFNHVIFTSKPRIFFLVLSAAIKKPSYTHKMTRKIFNLGLNRNQVCIVIAFEYKLIELIRDVSQ
jgi:hypothetical protein